MAKLPIFNKLFLRFQTFVEKLLPNSLPLHTILLENTTLFFGPFRKGNVTPLERCVMLMPLLLYATSHAFAYAVAFAAAYTVA